MRSTLAVTLSVAVALSAGIGLVHAQGKGKGGGVGGGSGLGASSGGGVGAGGPHAGGSAWDGPGLRLRAWRRETKSQGRSGWWRDRFRSRCGVEDGMEWREYAAWLQQPRAPHRLGRNAGYASPARIPQRWKPHGLGSRWPRAAELAHDATHDHSYDNDAHDNFDDHADDDHHEVGASTLNWSVCKARGPGFQSRALLQTHVCRRVYARLRALCGARARETYVSRMRSSALAVRR